MRICVLCEDSKVELARENSKKILKPSSVERSNPMPIISTIKRNLNLPQESGHLRIPVSETGNLPATHWFCFLNVTEAGYAKLKSVQEHSVIEESGPKEFLEKWNLKIIK